MFKNIKGEWIKLKTNKSFFLVFSIISFISIFYFFNLLNEEFPEDRLIFQDNLSKINKGTSIEDLNIEENLKQLKSLLGIPELMNGEEKIYYNKNLEIYKEDLENDKNFPLNDIGSLEEFKNRADYIEGYKDELDNSCQNLIEISKNPVLKSSSFLKSASFKKAEAYKKLASENINLTMSNDKGLYLLKNLKLIDYLLIILLFFTASNIFQLDRENKTIELIASFNNGIRKSNKGKIGLFITISFIFAFIIWFIIIISIYSKNYFGDLNRSILSCSLFRNFYLNLSIKKFLYLFFLGKLLNSLLLAGIITLIFSFLKDTKFIFIIFISFIILSFSSYKLIAENSNLNLLFYLSIFRILDIFSRFTDIRYINLFGLLIKENLFYALVNLLLCPLIFLISLKILLKEKNNIVNKEIFSFSKKIQAKTLLGMEIFKSFIMGKMYIVFLILIASLFFTSQIKLKGDESFKRIAYLYNFEKLKGNLNSSKIKDIEDLEKMYLKLEEKEKILEDKFLKKEISDQQYNIEKFDINRYLNKKEEFLRIRTDAINSYEIVGENKDLFIIDERKGEFNFEKSNVFALLNIISYTFIILYSLSLFSIDRINKLDSFLKTFKNGHLKLFNLRILIGLVLSFLIAILGSLVILVNSNNNFYFIEGNILIQSLRQLSNFGKVMSFYKLYILLFIYTFISLFLSFEIGVFLENKFKNTFFTLLISGVIFIIPNIILLFNGPNNYFILNYLSSAYTVRVFLEKLGYVGFIGWLINMLALIIFLFVINREIYLARKK